MRKIKIKFVDFNVGLGFKLEDNEIVNSLSKYYDVEICDDPDYIFYSVFGLDHLKYDCVRIFYTGECYTPDFNECDYAMGYDRLSFGDRYLRLALYRLFRFRKSYEKIINRPPFDMAYVSKKTGFCNFVYSNCFAQSVRARFFDMLSAYKRIESGGRYKNNVGGPVADKLAFQEKTKFTIAFENTSYAGYSTEKIVEAFAAGTVPIYYGDPQISQDFDTNAFVNVHDFSSLEDVIKKVQEIDNNDELYLQMLNTPPIKNPMDTSDLDAFLKNIFDQEYQKAFRRPRSHTSTDMEIFKRRYRLLEKYFFKYTRKVKNTLIRIKKGTLLWS